MTTIESAVKGFLAYCRIERGLAQNTVTAYASDLADLQHFLAAGGIVDVPRVDLSHLQGWLKDLAVRGLASSSIARRVATVRMFWQYLAETRRVRDLGSLLEAPKVSRKVPLVLRPQQIQAMVEAVRGWARMCWRDKAILELFFASGLRASELTGIRIADVDLGARTIRVLGKGRKERIVLFGQPALSALQRYLSDVRPQLVKGQNPPQLFVSRTGRPLDRENIFRLVVKLARRAGIQGKVSPHSLRHAFATSLHAGGADLRVIQALLGHESLTTTQRYTTMDASRLKAIHAKYHPLETGLAAEIEALRRQQRPQDATEAPTDTQGPPRGGSARSRAGKARKPPTAKPAADAADHSKAGAGVVKELAMTAVATKVAVDRLNAMMRDIQAKRKEIRQLADAHGLNGDRWGRADEAAGELDCALTDLAFDLQDATA